MVKILDSTRASRDRIISLAQVVKDAINSPNLAVTAFGQHVSVSNPDGNKEIHVYLNPNQVHIYRLEDEAIATSIAERLESQQGINESFTIRRNY